MMADPFEQYFDGAEEIRDLLLEAGHDPQSIDDTLALFADNPDLRNNYLDIMEMKEPKKQAVQAADGYVVKNGKRYLARRSVGYNEPVPEKAWDNAKGIAETMMGSELAAMSALLNVYAKNPNWETVDCPALLHVLKEQSAKVSANDMSGVEAMLMNQSIALEQMFSALAAKAFTAGIPERIEGYLKLALRCQNQSRASLETLGRIKNPVLITKQLNVANQQQVNNHAPAREKELAERTIEGEKHVDA